MGESTHEATMYHQALQRDNSICNGFYPPGLRSDFVFITFQIFDMDFRGPFDIWVYPPFDKVNTIMNFRSFTHDFYLQCFPITDSVDDVDPKWCNTSVKSHNRHPYFAAT